jgi:hypothetical protein
VLAAAKAAGGRLVAVMVASEGTARRLQWGFDLLETDLVGRYALPLLVSNALAWLTGEDEHGAVPLEPGRPWAVEAPRRDGNWRYLEPGATARPARLSAGQLLASSERHGLHVWQDERGHTVVRPSVIPATETVHAGSTTWPATQPRPHLGSLQTTQDGWPRWLGWLAAALLALAVEWLLYLRRRTA